MTRLLYLPCEINITKKKNKSSAPARPFDTIAASFNGKVLLLGRSSPYKIYVRVSIIISYPSKF